MDRRRPITASFAALAVLATLAACGKKAEAPPPPLAPVPAAPAAPAPSVPASAASAASVTPAASAPAAPASAPAPAASQAAAPAASTDVDNPTPLPAKEIKGTGTQQKVSYYWRFNAPAGPLKLTATAKNAPSGATNALRFGLYDLKANQICSESHGNTTSDKTVELKCTIEKAQPVNLRLDLSEETIDFAVQVEGNIELPAAGATAAATPPAGPGSTDIDEPTRLKTNRVKGEGPKKPVTYYYAFNAGPGELTLTIDGRNTAAASTEALIGGLYTLRSEKICETQLGNTTLEKRAVTSCKVDKRQPVILRLDLSAETVDFRARFEGPHDFEDYVPPKQVTIALDAAVLFDSGSHTLKAEAKKTLDEAAARVKKHAGVPVTISGHTDSVGNDASNQKLSENRAAAVRDYFVNTAGVPAARLSIKGYGKTQPVADNVTDAGRARNRRVEIQFTPK
jgi:outer membrane protein OmpA-like peptidoglycan-associated protein/predicted small lipoprotein YifL